MENQASELLLKENKSQKNKWAILGNGSIALLLYNLMVKEGFSKKKFIGFIVSTKDQSNNLLINIFLLNG